LFHAYGRTAVTNLIAAFRRFSNALIKGPSNPDAAFDKAVVITVMHT